MQSLGIVLIVIGALGLTIAAVSKLLMQWPVAGKAGGISLGLIAVGGILWVASPSGSDTPKPEEGTRAEEPAQLKPPTLPVPPPRLPPPPPPPPPPANR
jgi:hypothetical protein